MAQQPNIELDPSDLPRSVPQPAPPRRWQPSMRPGMITAPDQVPRGGSYGTPGPDMGWAYVLIRRVHDDLSEELEAVLAALVVARASRFGRAPIPQDLEVAEVLCGLGDDLPEWLSQRRERWVEAAAHEPSRGAKGRTAVSEIDHDLLDEPPERVRWALTHRDAD